jgi:hypothetical protein
MIGSRNHAVPPGDECSNEQRHPGHGGPGPLRPLPEGVLLHPPRHEQLLQWSEVSR